MMPNPLITTSILREYGVWGLSPQSEPNPGIEALIGSGITLDEFADPNLGGYRAHPAADRLPLIFDRLARTEWVVLARQCGFMGTGRFNPDDARGILLERAGSDTEMAAFILELICFLLDE